MHTHIHVCVYIYKETLFTKQVLLSANVLTCILDAPSPDLGQHCTSN